MDEFYLQSIFLRDIILFAANQLIKEFHSCLYLSWFIKFHLWKDKTPSKDRKDRMYYVAVLGSDTREARTGQRQCDIRDLSYARSHSPTLPCIQHFIARESPQLFINQYRNRIPYKQGIYKCLKTFSSSLNDARTPLYAQ